jgi:transcriptional regulator GlxA family with amidase domain
MPHRRTRRVDIIVYPGFQSLEAVAPLAVFDHANDHLKSLGRAPLYAVAYTSTALGWVRSDSIVQLEATRVIDGGDLPDVALVVGTRAIETALVESAALIDWLREHGPRLDRLASMCSGSFFLAEAGLLDGKRATTHWNEARAMQARYPQIEVDAQPIFVRAGHILTSAGVTSGVDLALAIVEDDLGREVALSVARDLAVYLKRPGWQSQLSMHLSSQMSCDPTFRELQEWILSSLNQPLHLDRLAAQASMAPEALEAAFLAHTGVAHQEFVETARFELARALIEDSAESPHVVAMRCGMVSVEHMDAVFTRRVGVSAGEFRERCLRRRQDVRSNDLEF